MTLTTKTLSIGDRVRFSSEWLRSTASYTSGVGQLRGTVKDIKAFRSCPALVQVEWDQPYFAERTTHVLISNLQICK